MADLIVSIFRLHMQVGWFYYERKTDILQVCFPDRLDYFFVRFEARKIPLLINWIRIGQNVREFLFTNISDLTLLSLIIHVEYSGNCLMLKLILRNYILNIYFESFLHGPYILT